MLPNNNRNPKIPFYERQVPQAQEAPAPAPFQNAQKTGISFAKELPLKACQKNWLETARMIAQGMALNVPARDMAAELGLNANYVGTFISEIKRAAHAGFENLEDYFAAGRPCAYGKKVDAEQKEDSQQ
jgi:hypothetical protein